MSPGQEAAQQSGYCHPEMRDLGAHAGRGQLSHEWYTHPEWGIEADHDDQHHPPHCRVSKSRCNEHDDQDRCGGGQVPHAFTKEVMPAVGRRVDQQVLCAANVIERGANRNVSREQPDYYKHAGGPQVCQPFFHRGASDDSLTLLEALGIESYQSPFIKEEGQATHVSKQH